MQRFDNIFYKTNAKYNVVIERTIHGAKMKNRVYKRETEKTRPKTFLVKWATLMGCLLLLNLVGKLRKCCSPGSTQHKKQQSIYSLNLIPHLSKLSIWSINFPVGRASIYINNKQFPIMLQLLFQRCPGAGHKRHLEWG